MFALIFLTVALISLLIFPLKVTLIYENGKISLKTNIPFFKKKFSKKKKNTENSDFSETDKLATQKAVSLTEKLNFFAETFPSVIKRTRRFINIDIIEIKLITGTGDAALTAISCGALWAVIYNLLGILGVVFNIKDTSCDVSPDYTQSVFISNGKCIFSTRIAYIIFIAIIILLKLKSRKGKEEQK